MKRQFTVYGEAVTEEQDKAALARMRSGQPFRCCDIADAIADHKDRLRVADRLLQRERRAGNIRFNGRTWQWVGRA